MVSKPTGLTIADHYDKVEITYTDNSTDEDEVRLERDAGNGWETVQTYSPNTTTVVDDSPMFYGGVEYRVVHENNDGQVAMSDPVSTTPAQEGEKLWSGGTSPGSSLDGSVSEAADALMGSLTARERALAERFLRDPPEEFYVAAFSGRASAPDGVRFGDAEEAQLWRDRMVQADQAAETHYPAFHEEYFGLQNYSPDVVGPGLYAEEAADKSLFDDFKQKVDAPSPPGTGASLSPTTLLAEGIEEIHLQEPRQIGDLIAVVDAGPVKGLYTGQSAPSGHLDPVAEALQTFLEDGLATLQSDHPDNFDEYFGYTSVPIVDNR